jgi:hypothetical protein
LSWRHFSPPGQFFKPHQDGLYINAREEHSIFSVVVYLNETCPEGTQGGNLRFLNPKNPEQVTASFRPTKGSAFSSFFINFKKVFSLNFFDWIV